MSGSEIKYWIGLSRVYCLGPVRLGRLLRELEGPERIWKATRQELAGVQGIGDKIADKVVQERERVDLSREWQRVQQAGVQVITLEDGRYPENLRSIHDPPHVLYCRGELEPGDATAIGIVGTRKYTPYGKRAALKIAGSLARHGFTIVSGLARGIDTFAHQGALKGKGRTIAVLGCGLDRVYPGENAGLARKIAHQGAVVSEFPLGTRPLPQHFPRRNRIISGLSLGILVVEAAEKSGSLITTDFALEQGRDVYAVPGNIDSPYSAGCNRLIKEGAVLVKDPLDILEEMGYEFKALAGEAGVARELSPEEKKLLDIIPHQAVHVDQLQQESGLPPGQLNSLLTGLELSGAVKQLLGKFFVKTLEDA